MFSQTIEYSLRASVALAAATEPMTTANLAAVCQVPAGYLAKIMNALVRGGVVRSQRGIGGGFVFARPARDVSVWDVISAVDPIKRVFRCPLGRTQHEHQLCPLHARLDAAIASLESTFRNTSIAELQETEPLCSRQELADPVTITKGTIDGNV